jgi:hypothetical protein
MSASPVNRPLAIIVIHSGSVARGPSTTSVHSRSSTSSIALRDCANALANSDDHPSAVILSGGSRAGSSGRRARERIEVACS